MPAINILLKPASGLCNMNCDYCFYCDEAKSRAVETYGIMPRETLKNIIRKTLPHAQGYAGFLYQGGEPTLRGLDFFRDAVQLQKQYNRKGIPIHNALQTNGYHIDEEWCRLFREENFLIGLSVDGTKEIHDKYRRDKQGNGTYERVLQTSALLERCGVEYNILTVVTRELADRIEEVYAAYKQRGWHYQQYILCLAPLDAGPLGKSSCSPTPKQYGDFLIRLFHLWYEDARRGQAPYIRELENYIRMLQGYLPENCAMRGTCTIQNVVEANGNVYPCDFYALDNYCLGNYNKDRFPEMQNSAPARDFLARSGELAPECQACRFFFLCRGGCQRNRIPEPGTGIYRNAFCESYRRFFEECLEKMKLLADR